MITQEQEQPPVHFNVPHDCCSAFASEIAQFEAGGRKRLVTRLPNDNGELTLLAIHPLFPYDSTNDQLHQDIHKRIVELESGQGFKTFHSGALEHSFGVTQSEQKKLINTLHCCSRKTQGNRRYQYEAGLDTLYCSAQNIQTISLTTPWPQYEQPLKNWLQDSSETVRKISQTTSAFENMKCGKNTMILNIHTEELTDRLHWHQDLFRGALHYNPELKELITNDHLIDILHTVVIKTPSSDTNKLFMDLGVVSCYQPPYANHFSKSVSESYKFCKAIGKAVINTEGHLINLTSSNGTVRYDRNENIQSSNEDIGKNNVYEIASPLEQEGAGYGVKQTRVYSIPNKGLDEKMEFVIVHSSSPLKQSQDQREAFFEKPLPQNDGTDWANTLSNKAIRELLVIRSSGS